MPFTQPWLDVDFGSAYGGLGTVGYRLYKSDGTDSVARTTAGVVDLSGNGAYGVANVSIPDDAAGVEWDTGGGSPVYAVEDLEPYRDRVQGIADQVWDEAMADHVAAGSMGLAIAYLYDGDLIDDVQVAVWEADVTVYAATPGSFGELLWDLPYMDGVYISGYYGTAGTTYPTGTRRQPAAGPANARTIADAHGGRKYLFLDDDTQLLLAGHPNWVFASDGIVSLIYTEGQDVGGSAFLQTLPLGAPSVNPQGIFEGVLYNGTYDTNAFRCLISEKIIVDGGYYVQCMFAGTVSVGGSFDVFDSGGYLKLENMDSETVNIRGFRGHVEIASSCTGGYVVVEGVGRLVDNSGAACYVDKIGWVENDDAIAVRTSSTGGSTTTTIQTPLTQPAGYFDNMQVVVHLSTGPVARNINSSSRTNGYLEFDVDGLPSAPQNGDLVTVLSRTGEVPQVDVNAIVDAVWDEDITGHLGADTAGLYLYNSGATADPAVIADAVWDELAAEHVTPDTMGAIMSALYALTDPSHAGPFDPLDAYP